MADATVCPTCGRRFQWKPTKVCAKCQRPMSRGDKFRFMPDGTIQHRSCEHPDSYEPALMEPKP